LGEEDPLKLSRQEAEDFLYTEARLLDEGRLEQWLKLFTDDGFYWIPIVDESDPEIEPSILYDDRAQLAQRVHQILHQPHYSQKPSSRTVHVVSNVEVFQEEPVSEAVIVCNVVVFEVRSGGPEQLGLGMQRAIAARCEYRLRNQETWLIHLKKVLLIDRDLPIYNLTFIL
jgi:3-phenylpropionate/cinnamic acid dioxygenase small subunit